jgi:hypothetical protein
VLQESACSLGSGCSLESCCLHAGAAQPVELPRRSGRLHLTASDVIAGGACEQVASVVDLTGDQRVVHDQVRVGVDGHDGGGGSRLRRRLVAVAQQPRGNPDEQDGRDAGGPPERGRTGFLASRHVGSARRNDQVGLLVHGRLLRRVRVGRQLGLVRAFVVGLRLDHHGRGVGLGLGVGHGAGLDDGRLVVLSARGREGLRATGLADGDVLPAGERLEGGLGLGGGLFDELVGGLEVGSQRRVTLVQPRGGREVGGVGNDRGGGVASGAGVVAGLLGVGAHGVPSILSMPTEAGGWRYASQRCSFETLNYQRF